MENIQTSNEVVAESSFVYAGFWARFAARLVDGLVLGAVSIVMSLLLAGNRPVGSALVILINFGYYCWLTKVDGATIGKKFIGIKVVNEDGSSLTWKAVILREVLGKIVSMATLFIGYLMAAFTLRKRALHDMIAETVVIHVRPKDQTIARVIWLNILNILLGILGLAGLVFVAVYLPAALKAQCQSQLAATPTQAQFAQEYASTGGSINSSSYAVLALTIQEQRAQLEKECGTSTPAATNY